jgi:hypothetical protein
MFSVLLYKINTVWRCAPSQRFLIFTDPIGCGTFCRIRNFLSSIDRVSDLTFTEYGTYAIPIKLAGENGNFRLDF